MLTLLLACLCNVLVQVKARVCASNPTSKICLQNSAK